MWARTFGASPAASATSSAGSRCASLASSIARPTATPVAPSATRRSQSAPGSERPYRVPRIAGLQRDTGGTRGVETEHTGAPRRDGKPHARGRRRAPRLESRERRVGEAVHRNSHDGIGGLRGVRDRHRPSGLELRNATLNRDVLGRAEHAEPPLSIFQLNSPPSADLAPAGRCHRGREARLYTSL